MKSLSRVQLFATQWTVAHHAPLSMGFSRQEYCSGLPFPSTEDLPHPDLTAAMLSPSQIPAPQNTWEIMKRFLLFLDTIFRVMCYAVIDN